MDQVQHTPRNPYDWSLARPGSELHVDPGEYALPRDERDLPFADEALAARVRRLTGPEIRAAERRELKTIALCVGALLLFGAIGALSFTAAAIRLPEIERQYAADARI